MDYVIVGGGVYGSWVAWDLAVRGADVLLLEAEEIAAGASGGPGKRGVRANGRDRRELPLMRHAYAVWPLLHERLGAETGYVQCGHLELFERPRDHAGAEARAWMQQAQGIPTQVLSRSEALEIEPMLGPDIIGAVWCPQDGVSDHTATTEGVAAAAQRAGATLRTGVTVRAIERQGGRVVAVTTATDERIVVKKALILLGNAGVAALLKQALALYLPMWDRLPQALFTESVDPLPVRGLVGHAHRRLSMKVGPDSSVMISGGWLGEKCADGARRAIPSQVAGNLAEAVAVFPALEGVQVARICVDRLETETADGIPIIDRAPGTENLFFATGWSGHGWAIAPAVGELLAEWVFSGERSPDLAPFAYTRFIG